MAKNDGAQQAFDNPVSVNPTIPGGGNPQPKNNPAQNQAVQPSASAAGSFYDQFKSNYEQNFGQMSSAQYPAPPQSPSDRLNQLPNADKLNGFERWVYKALPGFAESNVGKALASFSQSPFGKVLSYLDIGAEGLERSMGVLAQLRDLTPGEEFKWKDAWAAGSLFYDTVKLPKLSYDANGKFTGITFDDNAPGAYAVTEARKLLQNGATLDQVRDKLYGNMGALALRAQLKDTAGHILFDPLQWALGAVKPVERLQAIRNLALTGKMDLEAARATEQTLRAAGNIEDADKVLEAMNKAQEQGKALTKFDRFAIAMTGGIPYMQSTPEGYKLLDASQFTNKQSILYKLNPFALSPQARASELIDMVAANVGQYLITPNLNKDPEEFLKLLSSASQGGIGDQWGHLASTIQGRAVQGILSNSDGAMKELGLQWKTYEGERNLLTALSSALGQGETERDLWKMAGENPDLLFKRIEQLATQPGMEELAKEIQVGTLTKENIANIGQIPFEVPLNKEQFYAEALVRTQDVAMRQAITQFGIKEKGILTKWSDALKAWESIPFIKANPANSIRNMVNNDVTLIGRGLMGTMSDSAIKSFWEGKWVPPQFVRGFGGIKEFDAQKATESLVAALNGEGNTLADKVRQAAGKIKLGPTVGEGENAHALFDFSHWSGQMEESASLRASTNGWLQFHQQYWNPKTGFTSIAKAMTPAELEAMEKMSPGITKALDEVMQASGADYQKLQTLMQKSLVHNVTSVMQDASESLGYKLEDVLPADMLHTIQDGLQQAMEQGNVREFMSGVKANMEQHLDEMFQKHVENLPGIVQAQVQAGGPMQFHRIFGKATDELWGGNLEHAMRMSTINDALDYAKQSGDYSKVNDLWENILRDSENHFNRTWQKFDAYQEGLKQGAKAAGITYPEEVSAAFKQMKSGWQDVFDFRNNEYQKFFQANLEGREYTKTFEDIQAKVDQMYQAMARKEEELYTQMDDAMASTMDSFQGQIYTNYRDQAALLRQNDRAVTIKLYSDLKGATPEEAQQLWSKYWQDRMIGLEQMRALDMRGSSAMQGDSTAINMFVQKNGPQPNTIYDLANQYGIPSSTSNGARNDRRILNTVNKYMTEGRSPKDVILGTQLPLPEDVKNTFADLQDANQALEQAKAAAMGQDFAAGQESLKAARDAKVAAEKAYEDALKANNIDGKMIDKLANNPNYENVSQIPMDVAQRAFEARAQEKTAQFANASEQAFIPDAEKMFPDPMPIESGINQLNYGRSYAAMDAMTEAALANSQQKSKLLTELSPELQAKVNDWMSQVENEASSFRSAAVQYGAFRRDSALLNYSRRTNFDNWVGHIAPFSFWTTHSMANWAIYSIDRPAMLATYLRTKKLFETAGLPNSNVPSRLKGAIRVQLPFTPKWMGDTFINPLQTLLPFDAWAQPWEQAQQNKFTLDGKAQQTLQQMLQAGKITDQEYQDALNNKQGPAWQQAYAAAQDGGDNYSAMDFFNMTMTPHAPLMWAYNAVRGQPNEIGPFTPMSRTMKNFATMMGVDDWSNSPYNVEGRIRKWMGLPAYDKWDDYRVAREISNIAADGNQNMDDVKNAMQLQALVESGKMTPEEAQAQSPLYKEATKRANQEYAVGWSGTILSLLGINAKAYPEGEQKQRELADLFSEAYAKHDSGDPNALKDFFDQHPEYESRLALFKSPEERLKSFMVDNVWSRWNELPKVNQDEIKSQLGSDFADKFINKETRNYDGIDPLQLQVWLKLIGGKPVGTLTADQQVMVQLNQLKLTDPQTAWRVQTFYDMRDTFKDWYTLQNKYYDLKTKSEKDAFLKSNPTLKEYWDSRRQWMTKNPDLVRFLTDDPKQIAQYQKAQRNPQVAAPTAQEIKSQMSPQAIELINQWQGGQNMPPSVQKYVSMLAQSYNMSPRTLLGIITGQ